MNTKPDTLAAVPDARLAEFRHRVYDFPVDPQILYLLLRGPVSDRAVGRWLVTLGVVFVCVQAIAGAVCVHNELVSVGYTMLGLAALGVVAVVHGGRKLFQAHRIVGRSGDARREMESTDGLLCHFEGLLTEAFEDEEVETVESLKQACAASAAQAPVQDRDELRAYWYWIFRLKEEMLEVPACWA